MPVKSRPVSAISVASRPRSAFRPPLKATEPRTEVWSSTAQGAKASKEGWISASAGTVSMTALGLVKAELELLKRNTPANKVYLPTLKILQSPPTSEPKPKHRSLYPDLKHKARANQLMREWDSLPSLRMQLSESDMAVLQEEVQRRNPLEQTRRPESGSPSRAKRSSDGSPGKAFPFIPCGCCERESESPMAKLRQRLSSGSAGANMSETA
mmetsp:Transcript_51156/g.105785  ORF Transcript_51156/g.105785 Transcript_51156/m.105785 type:complete len:212 (-) Transcript_51156:53-688(-)